jgi:hypothetical protein
MALESASFINGLVSTNPTGSDSISQGDDHLRLLKTVLKASLPDVDQAAATVIVKATAPTTQVKGTTPLLTRSRLTPLLQALLLLGLKLV